MGEIKTIVSGDVTIRKVIGTPTLRDVMTAIQEFYTGNPTKFVVWILTEQSTAQLTYKDIDTVVSFISKYSQSRTGGKTAFVAPSDLEFGIARMLDIRSELNDFPFEVKTFRKLSEAANWIGVDDLPTID